MYDIRGGLSGCLCCKLYVVTNLPDNSLLKSMFPNKTEKQIKIGFTKMLKFELRSLNRMGKTYLMSSADKNKTLSVQCLKRVGFTEVKNNKEDKKSLFYLAIEEVKDVKEEK